MLGRALAILLCLTVPAAANSLDPQQCSVVNLPNTFPAGAQFNIRPDKSLVSPNGKPVRIFGVSVFDYLFYSGEFRGWNGSAPTNQVYRSIRGVPGTGPSAGISEPTYFAKTQYINHANVLKQLQAIRYRGINLVRIVIEPAVQYANRFYVDTDGKTYPPDVTMLDDIVATSTSLGLITELILGHDAANFDPANVVTPFLSFIAGRYKGNPLIWINPANEFAGEPFLTSATASMANPFLGNVSKWTSTESAYVNAIRAAGFTSVIVLDDPYYAGNINAIYSTITSSAPFNSDPRLIYGVHIYTALLSGNGPTAVVESSFVKQTLPNGVQTAWAQYVGRIPMFIEEMGSNCATCGNYIFDPEFGVSVNPKAWYSAQLWNADALFWAASKWPMIAGVSVRSWFTWTGSGNPDQSALFYRNKPTMWFNIVQKYLWTTGQGTCSRRGAMSKAFAFPLDF